MMRLVLLFAGLLILVGIAASQEELSSADLVQFAVSEVGSSNQDAYVSGFDTADSNQIGYSSDGNVTQTISYDNIGNGSVIQWGESGNMPRQERTYNLDHVGDSGFTWQWDNGNVSQIINIRDSENLYLRQIIGGLRRILFPDSNEKETGSFWLCGKAVGGTGGLPLCAEKIAKRVFSGNATARDYYMLSALEEDDVFPPDNLTPHITLTAWNLTRYDDRAVLKYNARNFGKMTYNATLMIGVMSQNNTLRLDDGSTKLPQTRVIKVGNYTVPSMKGIEGKIVISLNGVDIKKLNMTMISN